MRGKLRAVFDFLWSTADGVHNAPKLVFEVLLRHTTRRAVEYAASFTVLDKL